MALSTGVRWAIATPALLVLLYIIFVGLLLIPWLQRHALYVHKIHSGFWHNLSSPESFGFAKNQIRPFTLPTPDGETLQAWHILPLDMYSSNREGLEMAERDSSLALKLLSDDPDSKVLISFHGNAGHIAQGWRTDTYRSFTSIPHTHTFTIDYRGFGRSTGSPTEAGLITDGIALVNYVLSLQIPPDRIAIVGQSLGTAVASAVALYFAEPESPLIPAGVQTGPGSATPLLNNQSSAQGYMAANGGAQISNGTVDRQGRPIQAENDSKAFKPKFLFAGTTLIAPFTNIPNLLLTYKAGGIIPLLGPIRPFKFLHPLLDWGMKDQWPTMLRLEAYFAAATKLPGPGPSQERSTSGAGIVYIIHAYNDADISFRQSTALYQRLTGEDPPRSTSEKRAVKLEQHIGGADLIVEFVEHGGHNRVCTYSEVNLAVRNVIQGRW